MPVIAQSQQPTNVRWLIVAMLMGFTFLGHFNRVSISVAGNEQFTGEGKMSTEQMGMVYSTFLMVYTLGMLPGGWIIDRLGPRLALTGMGLGMGFCVALTGGLGWSGLPVASLWIPLLLIRGLAGAVCVPLHPAAARSVAGWVPLTGRITANGMITAGALIGIAVCYPGFGWLMDRLNWPLAFVVCGTAMMVFAVVWFQLSSDSVSENSWANEAEKNLVPAQIRSSVASKIEFKDFQRLIGNRNLILLTLSYAAVGYFQYLFFYWIGYYFESVLNLPVKESRGAAFIVMIAMAVGMAFGGYLSDRLCRQLGYRWGCRIMAIVGMSLSAVFAWLGVAATTSNDVVILFSLALGALGLCEGIFWTAAPLLEKQRSGLACAFLNTVGNAGGLIAPMLTPWIGKHYGWTTSIAVACFICGLGAILWFWIDTNPTEGGRPASNEFLTATPETA